MADVTFQAVADSYRGYRCPGEPTQDSWVRNYIARHVARPYPKIIYPRPLSERASFLHTEWDKWIAGVPWTPRIAVKDGAFPYKVFLTGNYPTGTTWAWYIEEENGTTTRYLQLYNASPSAGTYNYRIVVRGQDYYTTAVDVSTTFWSSGDANIRNQFRIIDGGAGGGGDGSPATPYNNWADMYAATYADSSVLVILKGALTVNSATTLALGGTKPKQILARDDATWTFNLTGIADKFVFNSGDGNDCMLKGFAITGQAAVGANQSQVGQANVDDRCSMHDLAFSNLTTSGSNNHGCFGGDGDTNRYYLSILGCSADNIGGGGTNCEILTMGMHDALIDDYISTNPNVANKSFSAIHWKHDNEHCETRRATCLTVDGYQYPPINYGSGGSSSVGPTNIVSGMIRHCNLAYSTNGANEGCIQMGPDSVDTQTLTIVRNTFRGKPVFRLLLSANVANYSYYDGNLSQNAETNNGIGAVTNETAQAGRSSVLGDNYGASSGVIDSNGVPQIVGHLGRYGHGFA